jgi:hypothetical protein
MTHVLDDLELYALGALPEDHAERVAGHLEDCSSCRTAAAELAEIVARLPDAIPQREPPVDLKARILGAARVEAPPRRRWRLLRAVPDLRTLAIAAALVLLLGVDVAQTRSVQALQAERAALETERASLAADRDEYELMAENFAHGGRSWYMAGIGEWKGMGGNLVQPASGAPAFVLFHDLRGLPDGQLYSLWLISPDGKWIRGTTFRPDGRELQPVMVGQDLVGYERCAVTIETGSAGKREGPIVMQSRIAPPSQ